VGGGFIILIPSSSLVAQTLVRSNTRPLQVASGLGLGWYAEDENSLGSGGDNSASPTIAQLPTPRKQRTSAGGGGAVSAGRQAVLDRERRLKEEEAMRSFKKETEFRKVGSSGAEGR